MNIIDVVSSRFLFRFFFSPSQMPLSGIHSQGEALDQLGENIERCKYFNDNGRYFGQAP